MQVECVKTVILIDITERKENQKLSTKKIDLDLKNEILQNLIDPIIVQLISLLSKNIIIIAPRSSYHTHELIYHLLCSYPPPTTTSSNESTSPSTSTPPPPTHLPIHGSDMCFAGCKTAAVSVNLFAAPGVLYCFEGGHFRVKKLEVGQFFPGVLPEPK